MLRKTSALTLFMSAAVAVTTADVQAAGRLATARAARIAAAETTVATASFKARQPAPPPAAISTASLRTNQPVAPVIAPTACCPQPCLTYRHRGHHGTCCGCAPPVEVVLTACNPCTCCPVEIPVCVPGCCQGEPSVSCHRGLFCANVVDYDWACGYRVTVRFKHNGEVVVVSKG